jgi:hypothetical protein
MTAWALLPLNSIIKREKGGGEEEQERGGALDRERVIKRERERQREKG